MVHGELQQAMREKVGGMTPVVNI